MLLENNSRFRCFSGKSRKSLFQVAAFRKTNPKGGNQYFSKNTNYITDSVTKILEKNYRNKALFCKKCRLTQSWKRINGFLACYGAVQSVIRFLKETKNWYIRLDCLVVENHVIVSVVFTTTLFGRLKLQRFADFAGKRCWTPKQAFPAQNVACNDTKKDRSIYNGKPTNDKKTSGILNLESLPTASHSFNEFSNSISNTQLNFYETKFVVKKQHTNSFFYTGFYGKSLLPVIQPMT